MNENLLEVLLDPDNAENIVLFNENNEPVEFEQIAIVPLDGAAYVILKPAGQMEGIGGDEVLVFCLMEEADGIVFELETEDQTIDRVFDEYYQMLREAGVDPEEN